MLINNKKEKLMKMQAHIRGLLFALIFSLNIAPTNLDIMGKVATQKSGKFPSLKSFLW